MRKLTFLLGFCFLLTSSFSAYSQETSFSDYVQLKKLEVLERTHDLGIEQGKQQDVSERAKFVSTLGTILLTAGLLVPAATLGLYTGAYIGNRYFGIDEGPIVFPALTGAAIAGLAEVISVPLFVSSNHRSETAKAQEQFDLFIDSISQKIISSPYQINELATLLSQFDDATDKIRSYLDESDRRIEEHWYKLGYPQRSKQVIRDLGLESIRTILKMELDLLDGVQKKIAALN
ncbi:MAG: hypothetical protein AB7F43_00415 [Bacteriovoracia bacterium]